jgi:hypothetical protein
MRYRRDAREVDAVLFDGSHESAAEISRRFGDVSNRGTQVEVAAPGGHIFAGLGCWIVRDDRTRVLSVVDPQAFRAFYEPVAA